MLDIIFCALPYSNLDNIYSAPAVLKGVVCEHGYSARTRDFGCDLLNLCNRDGDLFYRVQNYFLTAVESDGVIEQFYSDAVEFFINNPSRYIGISVLSIYTHRCVLELLQRLKQAGVESKVIIGGHGLTTPVYPPIRPRFNFSGLEQTVHFVDLLQRRNLVDHVIIGDGEDAILNLLQTQQDTVAQQYSETFRYPVPNYDDYNLKDYLIPLDQINFPVTGSKGCVRDCDFCDVKSKFGNFRYRSGTDIANEMIEVSSKTGIYKFQFTDSLVNGGLKPFREFLTVMARHNQQHPEQAIQWNGSYICRPQNQAPQDLYELIALSGGQGLAIGAESGSNRVLQAMNKKTTVEALYHELEQFRKHGITCILLMIVGHWSESWEDFVEHCEMLVKITPYVRSGTISAVRLGDIAMLLHGSPSYDNRERNQVVVSEFNPQHIWQCEQYPDNTYKERVYRRLIVSRLAERLRIPTVSNAEIFITVANMIDQQHQEINQFYESVTKNF